MTGKIFINYRREDSTGTAARLHDRLAQEFGRENLFEDVVGVDLKARLSDEVAACPVFLTVIGPNWLDAKDEAGQRRLHHPDDLVAVEIAAALARNICIIPVLVDGARMPKLSWLPDSLKPLAGCQAVEVRQSHFDRDVEALVERVREALNASSVGLRSWRRTAVAGVAVAAGLLLVGWIGLYWMDISVWPPGAETHDASNAKAQAEAEAKRKSEETEQQRLATLKVEQERQTKAAAEAAAKRKSEEAEQQRVAALKAEQEERNRAEAEARARYAALISQGNADSKAGEYDRAIAAYNEAIRLDPKSALAFRSRGVAYANKGDNDRAIADFNKAIRLDPKSALAFRSRGDAYANKDEYDRAIADYNEAIRLDPKSALAFRNRGIAYAYKGDHDRAIADYSEAIRLDPKSALALSHRGVSYAYKGDHNRAIVDYNEAIRLDPNNGLAFCNRGRAKRNINDMSGNADIARAMQLDASVCR